METVLQLFKTVKLILMEDNAVLVLMDINWLIPTAWHRQTLLTVLFPITMDVFSARMDST
jgi:hypothetical protein